MSDKINKTVETFKLLMQVKLSSKDGDIKRECKELGIYDRYLQVVGMYFEIGNPKSYLSEKNINLLRNRCVKNPSLIYKGKFYKKIQQLKKATDSLETHLEEKGLSAKDIDNLFKADLMVVNITILKNLEEVTGEDIALLALYYVSDISKLLRSDAIMTTEQKRVREVRIRAKSKADQNMKKVRTSEDLEGLLKRRNLPAKLIAEKSNYNQQTVESWYFGWIYEIESYQDLYSLMSLFGFENIDELKVRIENSAKKIERFNKSIDTLRYLLKLSAAFSGMTLGMIFAKKLQCSRETPYKWLAEKNFATPFGYMSSKTREKIETIIKMNQGFSYPKISSRLDDLIDRSDQSFIIKKGDLINITNEELRRIGRTQKMSPIEIGTFYQGEVKNYICIKGKAGI